MKLNCSTAVFSVIYFYYINYTVNKNAIKPELMACCFVRALKISNAQRAYDLLGLILKFKPLRFCLFAAQHRQGEVNLGSYYVRFVKLPSRMTLDVNLRKLITQGPFGISDF